MFYTEEDIQPAVTAAVRIFGNNGTYVFGKNTVNITVATREFGKIWYGDVSATTVNAKCSQLARMINSNVFLFEGAHSGNLDFTQAQQFNNT
jgi:hypothetical protein